MRGINLFNSKTGLFNEKEYKKEIKKEKEFQKQLHKELKQKQKEEQRKRKVFENINKKKRVKDIPKHQYPSTVNRQPLTDSLKFPIVSAKIPTKEELENHLLKLSDKYDKGIKEIKEFHNKLVELGLTDKGLKEIKHETEKNRKKRIEKINKIHPKLIKTIEENKNLEKEIEFLHKKLRR